jgi:hypothetical protein
MAQRQRKAYKLDPDAFDPEKLTKALQASDPLGQVVRVHLYIEAALVALIETALAYPGDIDLGQASFPFKVDLAIALDRISPRSKPGLIALNRFRNQLAHHPEATFTPDQIETLIEALDPLQRLVATELVGRMLRTTDTAPILVTLFTVLMEQLRGWKAFAVIPTEQRTRYETTVQESSERLGKFQS